MPPHNEDDQNTVNAVSHTFSLDNRNPVADPGFRLHLLFCWLLFFGLSTLYCHGYALVVSGDYSDNLRAALQCVSRDWLAWAILSPAVLYFGYRHNPSTGRGRVALAGLLLISTASVGVYRILIEMYLGTAGTMEVLYTYLPRYLFIAATILVLGQVYAVIKSTRHLQNRLREPCNSEYPPSAPGTFVATKGNARVVLAQKDIICISASGNYLELHTRDNSYLIRGTIKGIQQAFEPGELIRVHRSHLVRLSAVSSVSRCTKEVELDNSMKVRLGQTYTQNLPHFRKREQRD